MVNTIYWLIILIALVVVVQSTSHLPTGDYNFGTGLVNSCPGAAMADCGLVKCGVAGFQNSCASVHQ